MGIRSLNRWQAFGGHLSFSLLLGMAVFALFRFVWYPDALFTLAGAGKLLFLVVGIDVVLGPLLTLIVFNPRKKSLIWDLAVILAVQIGALGYGVWVMAQSRPVFLVAVIDRLEVVSANELPDPISTSAANEFRQLPWGGPRLVGVIKPDDPQKRLEIALSATAGGRDLDRLPEYYVEFESVRSAFFDRAALQSINTQSLSPKLTERLNRDDVVAVPIKARFGWGVAFMRIDDGQILHIADDSLVDLPLSHD